MGGGANQGRHRGWRAMLRERTPGAGAAYQGVKGRAVCGQAPPQAHPCRAWGRLRYGTACRTHDPPASRTRTVSQRCPVVRPRPSPSCPPGGLWVLSTWRLPLAAARAPRCRRPRTPARNSAGQQPASARAQPPCAHGMQRTGSSGSVALTRTCACWLPPFPPTAAMPGNSREAVAKCTPP